MTDGDIRTASGSTSTSPNVTILFFWSSGTPEYSKVRAFGASVYVVQGYISQLGQHWSHLPRTTNIFPRFTRSLTLSFGDDQDVQAAETFLRIRDSEIGGELSAPEYQFDARQNFLDVLSRVFDRVTDQDLLDEAEAAMQRNKLNQEKDTETWAAELAKDLGKFTD